MFPPYLPTQPLTKHWVDGLPGVFDFVCMSVCASVCVWRVGKLSSHSLDSCHSQTLPASPAPPFLFSLSLTLHPPSSPSASPQGLKDTHTPNRPLYLTTFCMQSFLEPSHVVPCPVLLLTSHPAFGLLGLLLYRDGVITVGVDCINKPLAAEFAFSEPCFLFSSFLFIKHPPFMQIFAA